MATKRNRKNNEINDQVKALVDKGIFSLLIIVCILVLFKQGFIGETLFKIYDRLLGVGNYLFNFLIIVYSLIRIIFGKLNIRKRDVVAMFLLLASILVFISLPKDLHVKGTLTYETIFSSNGGLLGVGLYCLFSWALNYIGTVIIFLVIGAASLAAIVLDLYFNNLKADGEDITKKKASKFASEILRQETEKDEIKKHEEYPPMDLLNQYRDLKNETTNYVESCGKKITHVLFEKGVNAKVVNIIHGPTTIQYILRLIGQGSSLRSFMDALSAIEMELATSQILVEAPMLNTNKIKIEIPNEKRSVIALRMMLDGLKEKDPLMIPVGIEANQSKHYVSLDEHPHLLITGKDGSGKTSFLHSTIISMLMNSTRDDLLLLLIDPKDIEFANYEHLPHLYDHVLSNLHDIALGLDDILLEMERRYHLFANENVSNIIEYEKIDVLPYIVIVISEYVELSYDIEFERKILKIIQSGANAGIHIIISTNHVSPEVLTNRIRQAMPTRIVFALEDEDESSLLLFNEDATKLLSQGDLIYKADGQSPVIRLQSPLVTKQEINSVVNYILDDYQGVDLYEQAKDYVERKQVASASLLQKHFLISYSEACRLMDELEKNGIISFEKATEPRVVYFENNDEQVPPIKQEEEEEVVEEEEEFFLNNFKEE